MKKLVVALLVVAMVLSLASVAFASDLSDLGALSKLQQSDIQKLVALKVLQGYPDGTFKPNDNLTRAEFAKIATILAGMGSSADVLKDTPSRFNDVAAKQWYTGYINLAASQGYVKGFPDGTFRPNDKISYAEVVTVILRILGYDDNLPGPWPVDYIAKAASLDVTEDVTFNATAPCTRVDVAVMSDASLDQEMVYWDTDKEKFVDEDEKEDKDYTLLNDAFEGAVTEDVLFNSSWTYDADDEEFTVGFSNENAKGDAVDIDGDEDPDTSFVLAENAEFGGITDVTGLGSKYGDVIYSDDDEAIAFIDVTSYTITVKGEDIEEDGDQIKVEDKSYDVFGKTVGKLLEVVENGDDYYTVYLNEDDEIYKIGTNVDDRDVYVVDQYNAEDQVLETKQDEEFDLEDQDVLVLKNGAWVTPDKLAENDLVYVYEKSNEEDDAHGVDVYFQVKGWKEGSFDRAYQEDDDYTDVKLAGTSYPIAGVAEISRDGGDEFDYDFNDDGLDNLGGETVKYFLNKAYQVAYIMCDVEAGADDDLYGVVVDTDESSKRVVADSDEKDNDSDGDVDEDGESYTDWYNSKLTILLSDGTTATYSLSDDADEEDEDNFKKDAALDSFVVFTLDANGDIEEIDAVDTESDEIDEVDTDRNEVKIGTTWYDMTDATVIFNTVYDEDGNDDDEDAEIEDQSVVDEDVEGLTVAFKANDDNELEYVVFDDELSAAGDDDYCLVTDRYTANKDPWVDIEVNGATESYEVKSTVAKTAYEVYEYSITSGKIKLESAIVPSTYPSTEDGKDTEYVSGTITDFSTTGNWIEIDDTDKYFIDEDTIIVDYGDVDDDDPAFATLRDIDKDDDHAEMVIIGDSDDDKNSDVIKFLFFNEIKVD